jgi:TolA-binding protein
MWRVTVLILVMAGAAGLRAQDSASRASAIADREAAEERYRRLSTAVEGLLAAQAEQQRRIEALTSELRQLRAEAARPQGDFVTREELKQVVETVRELDQRRESDRRTILGEIESLGRNLSDSLKAAAAPRRPEPARPTSATTATTATTAYDEVAEHTVETGQTLSAIVSAYNAEFKKRGKRTSLKLVLDANPGVKPERLTVGQKIVIPLVPI